MSLDYLVTLFDSLFPGYGLLIAAGVIIIVAIAILAAFKS